MRLALNFQRVDPTRGGAETYIVDLCQRLIQAGHRVDLYAESWREGALPAEVHCVAVPTTGVTRLGRLLSFGRNSEKALSKTAYDCTLGFINTWHHDVIIPQGGVHRGSLEANAKRFPEGWRREAYKLGKAVNPKYWAYRWIEQKQYHPARQARVVAVSQMVREHLQRHHHVPRTRIHVIPNAIDATRLRVAEPDAVRSEFRKQNALEPNDVVGLFVAHNFALKGLEPLLHSLAQRKRFQPDAKPIHLLVCGGGKIPPFRRLAQQLGLGDTIHWIGYAPDIRACFWSSDFFVLPSYYDPCSLVVFEALASRLPVITTRSNGAGEVITEGREGYVVTAPDSYGEMIHALNRMAHDPTRLALAEHAESLGLDQSLERHVARLVDLFHEVADEKMRTGPHLFRTPGRRVAS